MHPVISYLFLGAPAQRALQVLPAGLVPVLVPVLVPGQALIARKRIGTYESYEYQVVVCCGRDKHKKEQD